MTYNKKTWKEDGTTPITAAELNRMENGIAALDGIFQKYSVAIGVANQPATANTDTQLTLTSQGNGYSLDSNWSLSNWTCPEDGVYEINTNILVNAPAGSLTMAKLYVNGANDQFLYSLYTSTAQLIGAGSNTIKKLIAGDVLKFYVNNSASGATIGGNYSRINIKRIG